MTQYRQRVEAGEHGELQEPVDTATNQPTQTTTDQPDPDSLEELSVTELRKRAAEADIEGRSSMDKEQLIEALS